MNGIPHEELLTRVRAENAWWREPHRVLEPYSRWRPRLFLGLLSKVIRERRVHRAIVVMGPRQVGKTVLLHHAIQALLESGVPPRRIAYLSVDYPPYKDHSLEALLDLYGAAAGIDPRQEEVYVFFDEIQYLEDWEVHLKSLVDRYPALRAVVSGSAAAALRLKSRESGAGRFTDFRLPPLTFFEFLDLRGLVGPVLWHDPEPTVAAQPFPRREPEEIDQIPIIPLEDLNEHFVEYLNVGGFPEAALSEVVRADLGRFVKSDILDKVLLRDLPSLYGIQDTQELNALFATLVFNTAAEVSIEQLSQRSGVAKNTIRRYLEYLEAAFLIRVVHRVDRTARRFQRARRFKVYLVNPAMRTAMFAPLGADDLGFGALVETGVFSQWFHEAPNVYYARWGQDEEVDLVRMRPDLRPAEAIEVKWSDRILTHMEELAPLIRFCRDNDLERAIVTTRTVRERRSVEGIDLRFVPVSAYTMILGYEEVTRAG